MASIIERIDLGGASNPMRVLIRLTAPSIIERIDLGCASNLMGVRVGLTAADYERAVEQ